MSNTVIIKHNGKEYGWLFNNYAFKSFALNMIGKNYIVAAPYALLYSGLTAYCFVKQTPETFTFEEVCEMGDELAETQPELIKQLDEIFTKSKQFKGLLANKEELKPLTDDEKKNTSMTA